MISKLPHSTNISTHRKQDQLGCFSRHIKANVSILSAPLSVMALGAQDSKEQEQWQECLRSFLLNTNSICTHQTPMGRASGWRLRIQKEMRPGDCRMGSSNLTIDNLNKETGIKTSCIGNRTVTSKFDRTVYFCKNVLP